MIATTDSRHSTAQKLRKMTVKQLRDLCKQLSLKGYSKFRKDDLIDFIIDEVWDSEVEQQCQEIPAESDSDEASKQLSLCGHTLSYAGMSAAQVRQAAKGRVRGYSRMSKQQIINKLAELDYAA